MRDLRDSKAVGSASTGVPGLSRQVKDGAARFIRTKEQSDLQARLLIVDDHEIVRQGIRRLLSHSRPEWQICGEASSGAEAINSVKNLKPDVVVLDIAMPGMNGLEAAKRILFNGNHTRIIIFTMHESEQLSEEVRGSGARGYVQKSQAARDLVQAIECVLQGGTFFMQPVE